ncbi:MAG: FtsX-like permease family protein [Bryobacteraceae bacterium]
MEEMIHDSTGSRRFPMLLLLGVFSVLALALAAIGIVGGVGHSVAQRTHEIGVRMALGAETADVLRLMVNSSMVWVMIGLAASVARSAGFTRLLTGLLYNLRPLDPAVLGGVSLLLVAVALLAGNLPARRSENRPRRGFALRMMNSRRSYGWTLRGFDRRSKKGFANGQQSAVTHLLYSFLSRP